MPNSIIWSNSSLAISNLSGPSRRARADTGGPVIWILCITLCCTSQRRKVWVSAGKDGNKCRMGASACGGEGNERPDIEDQSVLLVFKKLLKASVLRDTHTSDEGSPQCGVRLRRWYADQNVADFSSHLGGQRCNNITKFGYLRGDMTWSKLRLRLCKPQRRVRRPKGRKLQNSRDCRRRRRVIVGHCNEVTWQYEIRRARQSVLKPGNCVWTQVEWAQLNKTKQRQNNQYTNHRGAQHNKPSKSHQIFPKIAFFTYFSQNCCKYNSFRSVF